MASRVWFRFAAASAFVSTIALQAGTQSVAWWYDHASELGPWVFELAWRKVYAPWMIVRWYSLWPNLFPVKVGLLISAAVVVYSAVCAYKQRRFPWQHKKDDVLDAPEWGTEKDLRKEGLLHEDGPNGVVLGMLPNKELVTYRGEMHVLFSGTSRAGKTAGGIIPSILSLDNDSLLVLDTKGELWDMTARWRSSVGRAACFDPTSKDSVRINPFAEIEFGTDNEDRQLGNVCDIIVAKTGMSGSDDTGKFYQRRVKPILQAMALHLYHEKGITPTGGKLLVMVLELKKSLVGLMKQSKHRGISRPAQGFESSSSDIQSGTIDGLNDVLGVFSDRLIDAATSESDFRISDLMCDEKPFALYLRSPQSDSDRLQPLMLLLSRLIVSKLMYLPYKTEDGRDKLRTLTVVAEEFADAKLDYLEQKLITMTGYLMRVVMVTQSQRLLKRVYGNYHAADENCAAIVSYSTIGQDEQSYVSGNSGQRSEVVERVSQKHGPFFKDHDKTVSTASHKTPLMSRQDVRAMPRGMQHLTVLGCRSSFLLHKPTWYEHPVFKLRGDNVRGGAARPGQMSWVLDAHRQRQQANAVVATTANVVQTNAVKAIQERTGWDAETISERVFGGSAKPEYVQQMINGSKSSKRTTLTAQVFLDKLEREPVA